MLTFTKKMLAVAAAVFIALPGVGAKSALADALAKPAGEVVLTLSGDLAATNNGEAAMFDLAMLREMGGVKIETTTIWTEGEQSFEGVALSTLLERVGVNEGTIRATAINDYTVEIPVADAVENGPIIAYELNGKEMSVRDKGPLWIIYPYDANSDYRSEVIYGRSIWQLDRLEAVN